MQFSKKITTRRECFEEHAEGVAHPACVAVAANKANGHCGRIGHNGVTLVGTPAAVLLAASVIAKKQK